MYVVVYYSETENHETLAYYLCERLRCGIVKISEARPHGRLARLWARLRHRLPVIEIPPKRFDIYDHVILVSPVHGSQIAPAMAAFIEQQGAHLRGYSFLTLCKEESPGRKHRLTEELAQRTGRAPRVVSELSIAKLLPVERRRSAEDVAGYSLRAADIDVYGAEIETFLEAAGVTEYPIAAAEALEHRGAVAQSAWHSQRQEAPARRQA